MPHSNILIRQICQLLEQEYDPQAYDYVIEKAIPGTRMYPDIAIVEKASRRIECAVEIGYTRPEKLTAYRQKHKIPDVRWYDKQRNLHVVTKAHDKTEEIKKLIPEWYERIGDRRTAVSILEQELGIGKSQAYRLLRRTKGEVGKSPLNIND